MILEPIPPAIRDDARLASAVEKGNSILTEVLQKTRFKVRVIWWLDGYWVSPPGIVLTLEERLAGKHSRRISLSDFDDHDRLRSQISGLWGELLTFRVDQSLDSLDRLIGSKVDS